MAAASSRYVHLSDKEHVALRRDMYTGVATPIDAVHRLAHVERDERAWRLAVVQRALTVAPGALQCIDEILQNALDECRTKPDVTKVSITYDRDSGLVCVENNGAGIPVEPFSDPALGYTPTVLFSRLRTSDKYHREANAMEMAGGMNGLGAKLTNLSSLFFRVETKDTRTGRAFAQEWYDRMERESAPAVTQPRANTKLPLKSSAGFVRISFRLDWSVFGHEAAPAWLNEWLAARAIDLAGLAGARVSFQGHELPVRAFDDLARLYFYGEAVFAERKWHVGSERPALEAPAPLAAVPDYAPPEWADKLDGALMATFAHKIGNSSLAVAVGIRPFEASSFFAHNKTPLPDVVGFVNGLACHDGQHVSYCFSQLAKRIVVNDKPVHVQTLRARRQVFFLVDLSLPAPRFSSQIKEKLESPPAQWPCLQDRFEWPDSVDKLVRKSKIVQLFERQSEALAHATEMRELQKRIDDSATSTGMRRRVHVEGLEDAALAGTGDPRCMLWVTEGKSGMGHLLGAMTQAHRAVFGMYPIKGKIINAMKQSELASFNNKEIMGMVTAMGLSVKNRDDLSKLRYPAGIVWATDQDGDGRHIAALGTVTLCTLFPALMRVPGFFKYLNTPLLRAIPLLQRSPAIALGSRLARTQDRELEFDSNEAFLAWKRAFERESGADVAAVYALKYFKGLATIEGHDMRRVLEQLDRRIVAFVVDEETRACMVEYFDKGHEDARKSALCELADRLNRGDTNPPPEPRGHAFPSYVYWDVGAFFLSDVIRSVFMMCDGLKPSQRKFLYALVSGKVKFGRDYGLIGVKVSQMAGAVGEKMHYHHGDASMQEVIVRCAQNIVGINNVPFVSGLGGFGNRMICP